VFGFHLELGLGEALVVKGYTYNEDLDKLVAEFDNKNAYRVAMANMVGGRLRLAVSKQAGILEDSVIPIGSYADFVYAILPIYRILPVDRLSDVEIVEYPTEKPLHAYETKAEVVLALKLGAVSVLSEISRLGEV